MRNDTSKAHATVYAGVLPVQFFCFQRIIYTVVGFNKLVQNSVRI